MEHESNILGAQRYCVAEKRSGRLRTTLKNGKVSDSGRENSESELGHAFGNAEVEYSFGKTDLESGDGLVGTRTATGTLHDGVDEPGNGGGCGLHIHIELMLAQCVGGDGTDRGIQHALDQW